MLDHNILSARLEEKSDEAYAKRISRHISPLKGLRGVPAREIVTILVETWKAGRPRLPRDSESLNHLFRAAHEDGMVAIGLTAAVLPDAPHEALDLAEGWLEVADDIDTADAIGWLLIGPGLLSAGEPIVDHLLELLNESSALRRRAAIIALMSALPVPIEGPAAAALRERMNNRKLAFVDAPLDHVLEGVLPRAMKDTDSQVRKAVARVIRAWAAVSPDAVETVLAEQSGGVNKFIREEANKGLRKGRRKR